MLFVKADEKKCQSVKDVMDVFCDLLGQKVNQGKSKVYFSPSVGANVREELCSILDFRSTPNLGKYLGFHLQLPRSTNQDFNFIIKKVQSRLAGWKGHLLSFASKVVLTKFVLVTVPNYVMQGVILLGRILNSLD